MSELLANGRVTLHCGDCIEVLAMLPENSVDSVVSDPPYHLTSIVDRFGGENATLNKDYGKSGVYQRSAAGFMGKRWDGGDIAFRPDTWRAVMRVLKPGGHLLAFSGTRTYHRMACAIEDAGFNIRDTTIELICGDNAVGQFVASLNDEQIGAFFRCLDESQFGGILAWVYGSGFPKSHNVSKGIDKHLFRLWLHSEPARLDKYESEMAKAKTADKQKLVDDKWKAIGGFLRGVTGTKTMPDIRGRKTVNSAFDVDRGSMEYDYTEAATDEAREWDGWGTALKPALEPICLARKPLIGTVVENILEHGTGGLNIDGCRVSCDDKTPFPVGATSADGSITTGLHSKPRGDDTAKSGRWPANVITDGSAEACEGFPDSEGQQYATGPKYKSERNVFGHYAEVSTHEPRGDSGSASRFFYSAKADANDRLGSKHPTVKPVDLMQYLVRLITPKGGTTLDMFAGTGTTGEAAFREGCKAVLIEREPEYQADIRRRMSLVLGGLDERKRASVKASGKTADAGPLFAMMEGK